MQHILLLGAGFSRNWGGWLATEAFEFLLGTPEVQCDSALRDLLWKHQRGGGFEDALAELQQIAEHDPQGTVKSTLSNLQSAVMKMFADMNKALIERDWEFTGDMRMQVSPFLAKFDAIFTLNQDVLLEHRYIPNVPTYGHPRFQSSTLPGMRRIPNSDPIKSDSWAWSTWTTGGDFAVHPGCQPIYKLHGSSNWTVFDGGPMLIMGAEKARNIAQNIVLSVYAEEFERQLSLGTRLMVIGYGFRDEHINKIIAGAADKGLQLFIIDPLGGGLADSLNRTRQSNKMISHSDLEKVFERTLIGASRRGLRETFGLDKVEHNKVMRFFDA